MGVIGAVLLVPEEPPSHAASLFQITFADSVGPANPAGVTLALSRDGSQLAFVGAGPAGRAIYLRRMDASLEVQPVRGTENGNNPQFSPDGSWLLFLHRAEARPSPGTRGEAGPGTLKKVPASGGTPITVADSLRGGHYSWGDRNEIIFVQAGGLWRVSAEGGPSTLLVRADTARRHFWYGWPHMLPGSEYALITIYKRAPDQSPVVGARSGRVGTPDRPVGRVELPSELGLVRLRDGRVTELGIEVRVPVPDTSRAAISCLVARVVRSMPRHFPCDGGE